MNKHLLIGFLMILISSFAVGQQTTYDAKRLIASDSLKIKTDWITGILKDSALTGASIKTIPTTDAVVKYIANRLAHTVKYTDTSAIISGYVRELRFLDSLSAVQTRIQGKLTKSDADTYYPAIQRMIDSLTAVQTRIQDKLTKSDADTYYPAIQRMIDSLSAVQTRIQGKLTKSDADTYYPAIQRMIDSLSAVQTRIQGKLTKSDADTYYPAIQRVLDSLTDMQSRIQTKQPLLGYTAENSANKATDFTTVNNVLYPTVQAVSNYIQSALTGVLKDRGNYDASGNSFPASGGSGSGGAIKTGDMWYISVGGTLGGKAVTAGAWVRSLTDAPGQTAGNWAIADGGFGFVPENVANKSTSTSLGTSNTLYPSQNAVKAYVDAVTANAANWNAAYGWGNHASAGYTTASSTTTFTNKSGNISQWTNNVGYLTSYTETDPTIYAWAKASVKPSYTFNEIGSGSINATTGTFSSFPAMGSNTKYFTMYDAVAGGVLKYADVSSVQTYLGLGSNAYTSTDYLPLTGGTLTGALNGTSALYSSSVTASTFVTPNYFHSTRTTSGFVFLANSATTGYIYGQIGNTSGNMLWGVNGSGGGELATGAAAYSTSITTATATALNFGINQVVKYTIDASGNNNWAGSGYFGSSLTANTAFNIRGAASNTIGAGAYIDWINTTTNNADIALQLNASNGLDFWFYYSGSWANQYRFNPTGNMIAAGSITAGTTVYALDAQLVTGIGINRGASASTTTISSAGTGDGFNNLAMSNAGGSIWLGVMRDDGISPFSGGAAYAGYVGTSSNKPFFITTNSVIRQTISATGETTFSSSLTAKNYAENTVSVSSAYTVADDVGTVFASSHSYTITLPSASSFPGRTITIKRGSSGFGNSIIISGVSLDSSEQGGSLPCGASAVYRSSGSVWYVISYHAGGCN